MNYFQDIDYIRELYSQKQQIPFRGEFLKKYSNRNRSIRDVILDLAGDLNGKSILDIGAGSGSFILKLRGAYPKAKLAAIDIAEHPNLLRVKDIHYKIYDGEHLPEEPDKFDVILMMHMLYHVPDVAGFLKQVHGKYVKEGTVLYITTKSKNTMPKIEMSFLNVLNSLTPLHEPKTLERDEAHFSRENAYEIIQQAFEGVDYTLKDYDFDTQLLVDNRGDLLKYILSTPRYGSDESLTGDPRYIERWKAELSKDDLFIDSYKESLYVVEF